MQSAGARRRKAYLVAFRVALSYFWLYLSTKIKGKTHWEKNIKATNQRNAERIKNVMLALQGLFIKFGQLISILSNVLPDEFRKPLEELQDNVPPHTFSKIEKVFQKELGQSPHELYTSFDPKPIAAASIGQVHRAKLGDQDVVVKIQHPQIDELLQVDLAIIKRLVGLVARFMDIKGIDYLYEQVEKMIEEELDYKQEAASMQRVKENLATNPKVYIPKVYEDYTTKKILTIEYCEGVKISNLEQIDAWGHDRAALTELFVQTCCQMILIDGFYHADPHPGNVMVNKQGQIIFIDFGAVSHLSDEMKEGIPQLIDCIIKQDSEEMVVLLRKLGFIGQGEEIAKVAEHVIETVQDFIYNELKLQSLNINDLSPEQLRKSFQLIGIQRQMTKIIQIPKDWVLLHRAVALISGVAFHLTPDWNPITTLQPYLRQELKDSDWVKQTINSVRNQLGVIAKLPMELQKTLRKANTGKLVIEVKNIEELTAIREKGQQFIWLILFIASVYFYLQLEQMHAYGLLYYLFQITGVASFITFVWSAIRQ